MSQVRLRPNPLVFLSSTVRGDVAVPLGLEALRRRLYLHGQKYGANSVWVDERSQPRADDADPLDAVDDFLGELDRCGASRTVNSGHFANGYSGS
jgi:hypothetical protein